MYLFKKLDAVYVRTDKNNNTPFNWENDVLYIIIDIKKDENDGISNIYELHAIVPDFGSGIILNSPEYFKENELHLYDGNDEDVLYFYNDAKMNYFRRMEDNKLKVNYNIKYKFKRKDILVLKNDEFENKRFFVVYNHIEDSNLYNADKNKLINDGYLYIIDEYREYEGKFIKYKFNYYKEEGFELYKGNDERIFKVVEESFKYLDDKNYIYC